MQIKYAYLICGNQEFYIDLVTLMVVVTSLISKQGDLSIITADDENIVYRFSDLKLIKK